MAELSGAGGARAVIAVRDGWAVATIYRMEPWEPPFDLTADFVALDIASVRRRLGAPDFAGRYHRLPARLELAAAYRLPDVVRRRCHELGVDVLEPDA